MNKIKIIFIWAVLLSPFLALFTLVQLTALGVFGDLLHQVRLQLHIPICKELNVLAQNSPPGIDFRSL